MDSKTNILVVDDNQTNVFYISSLLKNLDVNIIEATSGDEAIERSKGLVISLALLDIQMPEMDGYELAMRLNEKTNEQVPVIFITAAYPANNQILKGYKVGAVDYILKPFYGQILISKVKVFMELFEQKKKIQEIANDLTIATEFLSNINQSLTNSEEEYRALLNASPDGIILVNLAGIITDISISALKLFGMSNQDSIVGKKYLRLIPPGQTDKIRKIRELLKKGAIAKDVEFLLRKKNYAIFPCEVSVTRIERQNQAALSFMFIVHDITYRKNIEGQLLHSERLASLGEMASAMAHEINQPLNTISLVFDNLILEASTTENLSKTYFKKKSEKIFESIQRIKNTISHVRAFSRSNTDSSSAPFDINKSINNALSLMNEQIKHNEIFMDFQGTDDMPFIIGNTFEMEQVVINLISNARDALLEKKKIKADFLMQIKIRSLMDGQNIYLEVEDNGVGIKQENLAKVLLPFFSTKDAGKGTGLGLSITYGIIKNMNGKISIQSEVMKGTLLKIILPIQKDKA